MTTKRGTPSVWITYVPKLMVGEQTCVWQSWFMANHDNWDRVPDSFDMAKWRMEHTEQMMLLAQELRANRHQVRIQGQNRVEYRRESGLTLTGIPDLVGIEPDSGHVTVYDVKTGRPQTSHQIQVMMYMYFLPRCRPAQYEGIRPSGCVVYKDYRVDIPADAIDEAFVRRLNQYLDMLEADSTPLKIPSETDCRYCKITRSDCAERIEVSPEYEPPPEEATVI